MDLARRLAAERAALEAAVAASTVSSTAFVMYPFHTRTVSTMTITVAPGPVTAGFELDDGAKRREQARERAARLLGPRRGRWG